MDYLESRGREGRRRANGLLVISLVGSTVACAGSQAVTPRAELQPRVVSQCVNPARPLPLDSARVQGSGSVAEDSFLRISRTVPGGFTRLGEGSTATLAISMVDTTSADAVRQALLTAAIKKGEASDGIALRNAELVSVPFSLATLVDWNAYLFRRVIEDAARDQLSISSTGVNARLDRVEIAAPTAEARVRLEEWLGKVDTPCGLVVTKVEGRAMVLPLPSGSR